MAPAFAATATDADTSTFDNASEATAWSGGDTNEGTTVSVYSASVAPTEVQPEPGAMEEGGADADDDATANEADADAGSTGADGADGTDSDSGADGTGADGEASADGTDADSGAASDDDAAADGATEPVEPVDPVAPTPTVPPTGGSDIPVVPVEPTPGNDGPAVVPDEPGVVEERQDDERPQTGSPTLNVHVEQGGDGGSVANANGDGDAAGLDEDAESDELAATGANELIVVLIIGGILALVGAGLLFARLRARR